MALKIDPFEDMPAPGAKDVERHYCAAAKQVN
jgi:hypothetical protein